LSNSGTCRPTSFTSAPDGAIGPAKDAPFVQLNKKIVAATTARDVITLLERHPGDLDEINVVTALHRIAKSRSNESAPLGT